MTRAGVPPAPVKVAVPGDRIDWRPVLNPRGPWSSLVVAGSTAARAARSGTGLIHVSVPWFRAIQVRGAYRAERSIEVALRAAAECALLATQGRAAISSAQAIDGMLQARVLVEGLADPLDTMFWTGWSQIVLNNARALVIPAIDGWDACPLVWRDLRHALRYQLPVHVYAEAA